MISIIVSCALAAIAGVMAARATSGRRDSLMCLGALILIYIAGVIVGYEVNQ